MSKAKQTAEAIFARAIRAAKDLRAGSVLARVALGRCIIDLALAKPDIGGNGRVTYEIAERKILRAVGEDQEITAATLAYSRYVALRVTDEQIKILVDAGASFHNIYDSLCVFSKGPDPTGTWERYVANVEAGKCKDVRTHSRNRRGDVWARTDERRKEGRASNRVDSLEQGIDALCKITLKGDESEERIQFMMESLFAAVVRMGKPVSLLVEQALARVCRMKKAG